MNCCLEITLMESRWNVETIRVQGDAFHLESINYVEKESIEVRIRNSTSTEIKLYEAIPASSSPCKE